MTPSHSQAIAVMKVGAHTDMTGTKVTFTRADLASAAASYDAQQDPAPLVIGHPKLNEPAWGWVESLHLEGDLLLAHTKQVEPAFAEMVQQGRFAKVSSQFYPPASNQNPRPGAWYLRHVGFLGAAAPAVKGLGTVSFAAGVAGGLAVELDAPEASGFVVPAGYRVAGDNLVLMKRAITLQAASSNLSFKDAVLRAQGNLTVNFGERRDAADRQAAIMVRAGQLQAQYPGLSTSTAIERARSEVVFASDWQ